MSETKTLIIELPTHEIVSRGYPLEFLTEIAQYANLEVNLLTRIKVAIVEAMANSIEHGNLGLKSEWKEELDSTGQDRFSIEKANRLAMPEFAHKKIKIMIQYSAKSLDIIIQDEGKGFVPEQCETLSYTESHGRGIFLIKATMDLVEYDDNGRQIRMKKTFC